MTKMAYIYLTIPDGVYALEEFLRQLMELYGYYGPKHVDYEIHDTEDLR